MPNADTKEAITTLLLAHDAATAQGHSAPSAQHAAPPERIRKDFEHEHVRFSA